MAAGNDDAPSIREIAELTARLRRLSTAGRAADPAERAAFLADKDALIARIETATRTTDAAAAQDEYTGDEYTGDEYTGDEYTGDEYTGDEYTGAAGAEAAVMARAAAGCYAMVGPSARTWSVDPASGIPGAPVPEAEHRLVRDLIARERLDGAEPVWLRCADGGDEIVASVVPSRPDVDADELPPAATAVAQAHEAITPLTKPAADQQQTTDDTRAAEPAGWGRHEQPADTAAADDGEEWSR